MRPLMKWSCRALVVAGTFAAPSADSVYAQRAGQWQNDDLVDFKMAWHHYVAKK